MQVPDNGMNGAASPKAEETRLQTGRWLSHATRLVAHPRESTERLIRRIVQENLPRTRRELALDEDRGEFQRDSNASIVWTPGADRQPSPGRTSQPSSDP